MKGLPNFMWLDPDVVVAKSWSDAQKGKAVSIPGWRYKILIFVMTTLPRSVVRKVGMNLRKKQRK
jgi:short-subunit dehydrogenase